MSIEKTPNRRRRERAAAKRRSLQGTRGGPVIITRVDGSTEIQPAYTPSQVVAINAKARRKTR